MSRIINQVKGRSMVMIDWDDVTSLRDELDRALARRRGAGGATPPPLEPGAGGGSRTGSPQPPSQNPSKSVDNFSTLAENTQIGGAHYKGLAIQPMRYSYKNGLNACQHTAIKYVTRYKDKGTPIEDLQKAIHCIELLIQFELEGQAEKGSDQD